MVKVTRIWFFVTNLRIYHFTNIAQSPSLCLHDIVRACDRNIRSQMVQKILLLVMKEKEGRKGGRNENDRRGVRREIVWDWRGEKEKGYKTSKIGSKEGRSKEGRKEGGGKERREEGREESRKEGR